MWKHLGKKNVSIKREKNEAINEHIALVYKGEMQLKEKPPHQWLDLNVLNIISSWCQLGLLIKKKNIQNVVI